MLVHLRLVVSTRFADSVRDLLLDDDRATDLTGQPGAALDPPGDVIEVDIAHEALTDLLDALAHLGLDQVGGIDVSTPLDNSPAADELAPARVPELGDGVVRLRELRGSDIPGLRALGSDPRSRCLRAHGLAGQHEESDGRENRVRAGRYQGGTESAGPAHIVWAVDVDGSFAGAVDVHLDAGGRCELDYGIHPNARGRGIGTRAARLVVDHLFDDRGVEVVAWRAAATDLASWRVTWSLGFGLDGVRRSMHLDADGLLGDENLATLLRREPRRPRHPWFEPAVLDGDRVRLRPWRTEDAPNEPPDELAQCFDAGAQPGPDGFEAWRLRRLQRMSRGEGVFWCIADVADDNALGGIELTRLDNEFTRGTGRLGYWLVAHARGKDYLQDALELLVPHAFASRTDLAGSSGLGLHRFFARAHADDRASQRTLRRAGFREIGRERALIAHPDRDPSDAYSFELLAGDDQVVQTVEPAFIPVLTTARLRLRPWRPDDVPRPEHELDRDSLRFMPVGAQPTAGTFAAWLARRQRQVDLGSYHWCIARLDDDEPLGMVSVWNSSGDPATGSYEVGYWLYAAHRGHGYVREALTCIVEHAFASPADGGIGAHRLHAGTDAENAASQAVLTDLGFSAWGHDHEAYRRPDGSLSDGRYFERFTALD